MSAATPEPTARARRDVIDALRRPLELAAADSFEGLARVRGLGASLCAAVDDLLAIDSSVNGVPMWRARLGEFESLSRPEQTVEVARGLRLVAMLESALPAVVKKSSLSRRVAPGSAENKPKAKKAAAVAPVIDVTDPLAAPPTIIKGIGPTFAEALAERGLLTVEDLLWMVPRRYDDARAATPIDAVIDTILDGERAVISATVASARMIFARGRRWLDLRLVSAVPGGGASMVARWFGVRGPMDQRFPVGALVVLSGKVKISGSNASLANPDVISISANVQAAFDSPQAQLGFSGDLASSAVAAAPLPAGVIPRYPDVPGLPAARLRSACAQAIEQFASVVDDGVPDRTLIDSDVPSLAETLRTLHQPPSTLTDEEIAALHEGTSRWQRRLVFGELFVLGAAVAMRRRERRGDVAPTFALVDDAQWAAALPFTVTAAQQRSIREIAADLAQPAPMNRLLQGDVGSGKTAVAFAAAVQVARGGGQTALMVPTELLAEQHARTLTAWSEKIGLRTALLTASTPKGVRQSLLALLAAGQIDLVVGTHSLLSEGVQFARLGLAVIDEQHRFGVAQRVRLRSKSDDGAPHLLVVTATPIPRTLALTAYGDLDISILDELPPGRKPPSTRLAGGASLRKQTYAKLATEVRGGARAYVVCPLVEPGEEIDGARVDWRDATSVAAELQEMLPDVRVGLVHGRLASADRDHVMNEFRAGTVQVLVATTVIEVGVDVPEATIMIVEDADHFGLSQLHQLRGRIGRGGGASRCVLLTHGRATEQGSRRLAAMVETSDGFVIAERDLELRGPGELLGSRQAGVPQLRFGNIVQHTELLLSARAAAEAILDRDPTLAATEHSGLKRALMRRQRERVFGAEGG